MPTADLVQRWLRAERDPELEPEQHLGLDALVKKLAEFAEEEELKLDGPIVAEDVECCLQSEYDRRALGAWRAQRTDHGELAPSQCSDPRRLAAGCLVRVERKVKMAGRDKDGATVVRHLWRRSPRAVGASTAESDDVRELRKFVFGKIDEAGASAEVQAHTARGTGRTGCGGSSAEAGALSASSLGATQVGTFPRTCARPPAGGLLSRSRDTQSGQPRGESGYLTKTSFFHCTIKENY